MLLFKEKFHCKGSSNQHHVALFFWTKNNYHCSQISAKTFVKSELRIQEMQIRFPLAKSPGVEIASSQVLSAKPTGCRQEGGSQTEQNLVEEKHGQENQRVYKKLVFGCVKN